MPSRNEGKNSQAYSEAYSSLSYFIQLILLFFFIIIKAIDWNLSKTNVTSQKDSQDSILVIFEDNNKSTLKEGLPKK